MYSWIWRHLPFGMRGRIIGSLVIVAGVVALLWFVVFPAVEPILPNNDGQITDTGGVPATGGADVVDPNHPVSPNPNQPVQPSRTSSR